MCGADHRWGVHLELVQGPPNRCEMQAGDEKCYPVARFGMGVARVGMLRYGRENLVWDGDVEMEGETRCGNHALEEAPCLPRATASLLTRAGEPSPLLLPRPVLQPLEEGDFVVDTHKHHPGLIDLGLSGN